MATANIVINQASSYINTTSGSRQDLVDGYLVTLSNQSDVGVFSRKWTLVDKPIGSTATLSTSSSATTTFTPDVSGTYLISLLVNGNILDQKGAAVLSENIGYRVAAAGETTEFNTIIINGVPTLLGEGWAYAHKDAFDKIDNIIVSGGAVVTVSNNDSSLVVSPTSGAVVASLNTAHANTFTAKQTFSSHVAIDGYTVNLSGGVNNGQVLKYNGTAFVAADNSIHVIYATDFPGAPDLGAQINAADAFLGDGYGLIEVPPGTYNIVTPVVLSAGHSLHLSGGQYNTDDTLLTAVFSMQDNTSIFGDGPNTVIQEPVKYVVAGPQAPVQENLLFRDFQIIPRDANPPGPDSSSFANIGTSNSKNVWIERIVFNNCKSISVNIGGDGTFGLHPNGVWMRDCLIKDTQTISMACVNGDNIHVEGNTWKRPGAGIYGGVLCIDFEPNVENDTITNFSISNNIFDMRGSTGASGVTVQHIQPGPGVVANNVFLCDTDIFGSAHDGLVIDGTHDVVCIGNTFKGSFDQVPLYMANAVTCKFIGNQVTGMANGSDYAITVDFNCQNCTIDGNTVWLGNDAAGIAGIAESSDRCDFNYFFGNVLGDGYHTPQITIAGPNSRAYDNIINGRLVSGPSRSHRRSVAVNTNIADTDSIIGVDTSSSAITLTLPSPALTNVSTDGGSLLFTVQDEKGNASTHNITIRRFAGEKINGAAADFTMTTNYGQVGVYTDGTDWFIGQTAAISGAVSSVSNSDGSLTVTPTTGSVSASLNAGHANTFSALQTFNSHVAIDGYTLNLSGGAITNQVLQYNGSTFVPGTVTAGVSIGGAVTGGTNKSVLFIDASGQLAQENADFNYDASTNKLTVSGHISVDGYTINLSGGATTNQILQYNGTSFVAATSLGSSLVFLTDDQDATGSGTDTQGSSTFATMTSYPDYVVSIATTADYEIEVFLKGIYSTGGIGEFRILVGGSPLTIGGIARQPFDANVYAPVSIRGSMNLTAGSHTLTVQWRAISASLNLDKNVTAAVWGSRTYYIRN